MENQEHFYQKYLTNSFSASMEELSKTLGRRCIGIIITLLADVTVDSPIVTACR